MNWADEAILTIPKDQYAPGIWAGTEGATITAKIKSIDLITGTIVLESVCGGEIVLEGEGQGES